MKVLFQGRLDLLKNVGGDTIQIQKTAEALRNLGVEVDLNPNYSVNLTAYDLVHIYQLDWICEPYLQTKNAQKYNKPVILSPIHHSELEVLAYERHARDYMRRIVNPFIQSQELRDVLKNVYRSFTFPRKLYPTLLSLFQGYRAQQKKVLKNARAILVQTDQEAKDIYRDFGESGQFVTIPLGVSALFLKTEEAPIQRNPEKLLSVGRIESRKNQIKIIEAVKKLRVETGKDLKLTLVGALNTHNIEYYFRFLHAVRSNPFVTYIPSVKHEDMPKLYAEHKVCVSASWFETTGLTLLEAAICGCNIVSRDGDTGKRVQEYVGDQVVMCNPNSVESIKVAVSQALAAKPISISAEQKTQFTWDNVAVSTLKVYNEVLKS